MDCREFRELSDSYLAEELLVETNHEMIRHLEGCAACRTDLADRRLLRTRLRSAFADADGLRVRQEFVAALTADLRSRSAVSASRWARVPRWWALAAGVAIAASIAGGVAVRRTGPGRAAAARVASAREAVLAVAREAVGDHRDCALQFRLDEKPVSLEEGGRLYDPAYATLRAAVRATPGHPANVPIDIVEAHVCVFRGRRFAHLVLKYHNELVSVLVTQAEGDRAVSAPANLHEVGGFHVALFGARAHDIFVVSALDEGDTVAVARTIADAVVQHFAGA